MKKISIFILFLGLISANLLSQIKGFGSIDQEKLLQDEVQSSLKADQLSGNEAFIIGDEVEPKYYYVGPGDIISFMNLSTSVKTEYIVVSPEASIIIPRIGEISVKNLTLAQVKDSILFYTKRHNSNANVSISLYRPRKVMISVKGNLLNPGIFSLPASYRVSTALKSIEKLNSNEQKQPQVLYNLELSQDNIRKMEREYAGSGIGTELDYSSRFATVINKDGTYNNVDFEAAKINQEFELDPYIRENQQILVPYTKTGTEYISITGAVNRPARIPFKKGDKAEFLLKSGFGFTSVADMDNIKLMYPDNSEKILKYNPTTNTLEENYTLESGCGIIVPIIKTQKNVSSGFVSVSGEINKPGTYFIVPNKTKVKDIIDQAGGFTTDAYLPLAYIIRNDGKQTVNKFDNNFFELFKMSDLTLDDTMRLKYNISSRLPIVSCNFSDLYVNNSEADNVVLQDGDAVFVPKNPKMVYIFGFVKKPGYVPYSEAKTIEWYIEQAGGVTKGGKESRARIIRGINNSWIEGDDEVFVYAGDRIYIPTSPDLPPGVEAQNYSLIFTGVSTLVTVTYLILSLMKNN